MSRVRGFERESFGEGKKKMTKPVLGNHFGENWDGEKFLVDRIRRFVDRNLLCRNNYIKKKKTYWDDNCKKIAILIYF